MISIVSIIDEVTKETGLEEDVVNKVLRSMFQDVQEFTSKKKGYCIQVPQMGTFVFRVGAIPNYTEKQKATLAHWISRLLIGEEKNMPKTISAAKNNIKKCLYNLEHVGKIKKEFLEKHATYKPKTKEYILGDTDTDFEVIMEYIELVQNQLLKEKHNTLSKEDMQSVQNEDLF